MLGACCGMYLLTGCGDIMYLVHADYYRNIVQDLIKVTPRGTKALYHGVLYVDTRQLRLQLTKGRVKKYILHET